MMDPIKRGAGAECVEIGIAMASQLPVGGDYGALAPPRNRADLSDHRFDP